MNSVQDVQFRVNSAPVKRLSALAQLIRCLAGQGIQTTAAIAQQTGFCERQIWRAKAELTDAGVTDTSVSHPDTSVTLTVHPLLPPKRKVSPTPPLKKNYPPSSRDSLKGRSQTTKVGSCSLSKKDAAAGQSSDLEMPNQAADCLLASIQKWASCDARAARTILATNRQIYGEGPLLEAYTLTIAKQAEGLCVAPFRYWLKAAAGLKESAAQAERPVRADGHHGVSRWA